MSKVIIKIDDKGRGTLKRFSKPGQVYQVESPMPGQIILNLMIPAHRKTPGGHLAKNKNGMPVWICDSPVNVADLVRQMRDEI